jgi:hypothetical protein
MQKQPWKESVAPMVQAPTTKSLSGECKAHQQSMAEISDLKLLIDISTDLDLNELMQRKLNSLIEKVYLDSYS